MLRLAGGWLPDNRPHPAAPGRSGRLTATITVNRPNPAEGGRVRSVLVSREQWARRDGGVRADQEVGKGSPHVSRRPGGGRHGRGGRGRRFPRWASLPGQREDLVCRQLDIAGAAHARDLASGAFAIDDKPSALGVELKLNVAARPDAKRQTDLQRDRDLILSRDAHVIKGMTDARGGGPMYNRL